MNELLLENSALKSGICYKKADTSGRSWSVHSINKDQNTLGEFYHLYNQLRNNPAKFFRHPFQWLYQLLTTFSIKYKKDYLRNGQILISN